MNDDDFSSDQVQCSYCGKSIYADSPRCPKCGNYTDGLGTLGKEERSERRLAPIWVIAAWLAVIALLLPFLLALYAHFNH